MNDTISFNRIYVIQSLPDNETQTGSNLFNDIISRRQLQFDHLSSELIDIPDKRSLFKQLDKIAGLFHSNGIVPYLHFEMHGSTKGLSFKSGERILWGELRPLLSAINARINNNLFVSLATCYGAFLINAIDPLDRIPFYAFVGPIDEIKVGELEADWETYFNCLLNTRDFGTAIKEINLRNIHTPYMFYTGEDIFDRMMNIYKNMYQEEDSIKQKIQSLFEQAINMPDMLTKYSPNELLFLIDKHVRNIPGLIDEFKDYFLMKTDHINFFPEIRVRNNL